jgi:hypothetical protein
MLTAKKIEKVRDRIQNLSIPEPNTGCWLWLGRWTRDGYGQISLLNKTQLTHRVSYFIFVGEIPQGLEIDHKCRNKCCVNPAHLEPVTHVENMRRYFPHSKVVLRTTCIRGHIFDRVRKSGGKRYCTECHRIADRRTKERKRQRNLTGQLQLECEAALKDE